MTTNKHKNDKISIGEYAFYGFFFKLRDFCFLNGVPEKPSAEV